MEKREKINQILKINKIIFLSIIAFWLGETAYFGFNDKPKSNAERICDNIFILGVVACACVYITIPIPIPSYDDKKDEKKKERYFLIKYSAKLKDGGCSDGNLWFNYDGFPTNIWIKEQASKKVDSDNVVVENIFEFKSKEDFEAFSKI